MTMSPTRTTNSSSETPSALVPETLDLFAPVLGLEIRQVVGGLPGPVDGTSKLEILFNSRLDRPDHVRAFNTASSARRQSMVP